MDKFKFQPYEHSTFRGRSQENGLTLHRNIIIFVGETKKLFLETSHVTLQFDRINQALLVTPTAATAPKALKVLSNKGNPTVNTQVSKYLAMGMYTLMEVTEEGYLFKLSEKREYKS